jgi:peptidyl-prolyl cis-trans isomerase D
MMRTMRAIAPWIMLIVAVSFVAWMVFEVGMDVTGRGAGATDEVARVNGTKIDQQTFSLEVRNVQAQQRQQGLPPITNLEEQRQLEDAVLERLVRQVLIQQELERRGITVRDAEVRNALLNSPPQEILSSPDFQTDGQFDLRKYQAFMQSGLAPDYVAYLESLYRTEIPRQKLLSRVTADVYVSDAKLWRIYRDRHDSVTVNVLALVPQVLMGRDTVTVTEREARRYLRQHPQEFERAREAYTSFVAISRRANAADSTAALQLARNLREEIVGGADFGEVAARESADSASRDEGGDLGEIERGRYHDAFERAALALRPGQLSQPVLTPDGYHLIQLESATDTSLHARHLLIPIQPYGDHLDEVDRRADSLDLFAAEQDDPTMLDTVAADLGLPVTQAPPVFEGQRLQLGRFLIPDVHVWAFEAAEGQTSPVIETQWAYYVFRLDSMIPSGVPPFEEIESQVRRAARLEKQWERTRTLADSIAAAFARGEDIEEVAAGRGLRVQPVGPVTRLAPGPVLSDVPQALGAVFGLPLGAEGGPFESEYGIYFVEPLRRTYADSTTFAEQVDQLRAEVVQRASQARVQLIEEALRQQAEVIDRRPELQELRREQEQQGVPVGSPVGF